MKLRPKCINCNEGADYFLHGSWVCVKCYPHNTWNTPEAKLKRKIRGDKYLEKELKPTL